MSKWPNWNEVVNSLGNPSPDKLLSAVAEQMRANVLEPGRAALATYALDERFELGRDLLTALGAASLEASLEGPMPRDANRRAWLLKHLVETELQLRARVRARVEALLDDREWMAEQASGIATEVRPPRRRVCDQAYISMRQLVHPEEDRVGYHVESDAFLHMPPDAKDKTIEKARGTHAWNLKTPSPGEMGY